MINAKILSSTSTFNAVKYNDNKTKTKEGKLETGKLLSVRNFDLAGYKKDFTFQEIKNYFKEYGRAALHIKNQQFHAVLSVKGKALNESQLENSAHLYMKKMGYSDQPYLIYFHNDTNNNHVHIVSTRVGLDNRKINSDFERNKSLAAIKEISRMFGFETTKTFQESKELAFKFRFSTEPQFNLLMEREGYNVKKSETGYEYFQNGKNVGEILKSEIKDATLDPDEKKKLNPGRMKQIAALIYKYSKIHSPEPKIKETILPGQRLQKLKNSGFDSDLAKFLKENFNFEILLHGNAEKGKPYGYTIIDNNSMNVFKGSEILSLEKMLNPEMVNTINEKDASIFQAEDNNQSHPLEIFNNDSVIDFKSDWMAEIDYLFAQIRFSGSDEQEPVNPLNRKRKRRSTDQEFER